jgi:pimeloyl-ACP methyl ester carboxylesterase
MNAVTSSTATTTPADREQPRRGRRILRRAGLGCLGVIGVLVACAVFGLVYEAVMAPGDAARYPAPGQRVDIGGYSLHLCCTGEGSPTVILEAGFGAWSTDWATAQPGLSRIARTCSYDRAGLGWSDPGPAPRDPEHIAIELHTLLTNAGIEGPYVLAGHSIGGKHIRMFTELYPDEVLGLVFVEARHESAEPVGRTPEQNQQDREAFESSLNFYRVLRDTGIARIIGLPLSRMLIPGVENVPDDVQYENVLLGVRESTLRTQIAESPATTYSDDKLRAARPLGNLPVVVLSAGRALQQASNWETVQKNLVALSTNSRWTIIENSLHNIAFDDPDAVIAAVQDVIQSAQTGQPLASR